jgi:hypothetical protein
MDPAAAFQSARSTPTNAITTTAATAAATTNRSMHR